jgi:hypothetical protein
MAIFWVVAPYGLIEVCFYQTTRRNNPEDRRSSYRRENMKSHKVALIEINRESRGVLDLL